MKKKMENILKKKEKKRKAERRKEYRCGTKRGQILKVTVHRESQQKMETMLRESDETQKLRTK